jgi:hypothetical protein
MMPPSAMPPIRLMLAALWESFKSRTPAQRLAHARARLARLDALERAAIAEVGRMKVSPWAQKPKARRHLRRAERRLRRIQRKTDHVARIVGALDEAVNG